MKTVGQLIRQGATKIHQSSDSPLLDAEVLLAFALDLPRGDLITHWNKSLHPSVEKYFWLAIRQRQRRIPVAYLTGRQAFFDLEFEVNPATLIPRPFTETLVETTIKAIGNTSHIIADIGTGSGAIALTIARHAPTVRLIGTDISVPALRVAAANARRLDLLRRVEWRVGSLLDPIRHDDNVTTIIANLPYVRTDGLAERSIAYEPRVALDGGSHGLVYIEALLSQTKHYPTLKMIILEFLPEQADLVGYLVRLQGYDVEPISDGTAVRGLIATK